MFTTTMYVLITLGVKPFVFKRGSVWKQYCLTQFYFMQYETVRVLDDIHLSYIMHPSDSENRLNMQYLPGL